MLRLQQLLPCGWRPLAPLSSHGRFCGLVELAAALEGARVHPAAHEDSEVQRQHAGEEHMLLQAVVDSKPLRQPVGQQSVRSRQQWNRHWDRLRSVRLPVVLLLDL